MTTSTSEPIDDRRRWTLGQSSVPLTAAAVKEIALIHGWREGHAALFANRLSHTGVLAKLDRMTPEQGLS